MDMRERDIEKLFEKVCVASFSMFAPNQDLGEGGGDWTQHGNKKKSSVWPHFPRQLEGPAAPARVRICGL